MNGLQGREHAPARGPEQRDAVTGIAAGVPYLAIPPASGAEPAPMIIAWHAFEPPRSEAALAGALPLHQVDAWRCYLGLPFFGARLPRGGVAEVNRRGQEDYITQLFAPAMEQAAEEAAAAAQELSERFPVLPGHVGALGFGAGGTAALLCALRGDPPLSALAVVNPVLNPALVIAARERRLGAPYTWSEHSREATRALDLSLRLAELAPRADKAPLLIVNGEQDEVVPAAHGRAAYESLAPHFPEGTLRHLTVPDLSHTVGPEPGLDPAPPTPATVLADRALTEWFQVHLTSGAQSTHRLQRTRFIQE